MVETVALKECGRKDVVGSIDFCAASLSAKTVFLQWDISRGGHVALMPAPLRSLANNRTLYMINAVSIR